MLPVEECAALCACGHVLVAFTRVHLAGVVVLDSGFECLGFGLSSSAHLVSSFGVVILHPRLFMALGVRPRASEA